MKKLVILLVSFVLLSMIGYGQATPTAQVRVANATTAFGINVPIGYTVYDVGANKYFVCTAATASTATLTTGSANFTQLGGSGLGGTVTNVTGTSPIMVATGTTTPVVSINTDSLASWARRKDTATILLSRTRASHDYQAKGTYVTAVSAKLANVSGTTSIRIAPTVGIAKDSLVKMDSTASAGQIAVFSTSGTGLAGRSNASMASQLGVKTYKAFETEATVDSLTRYIYALSVTPVSTSVEVKINGSNLKATSQYTINGTKIYILAPIRTYDKINITCSY
jgi:hypothetical protein